MDLEYIDHSNKFDRRSYIHLDYLNYLKDRSLSSQVRIRHKHLSHQVSNKELDQVLPYKAQVVLLLDLGLN